ncbi:hypothetical protein GCM10018965_082640 [Nonomuraea roseola]
MREQGDGLADVSPRRCHSDAEAAPKWAIVTACAHRPSPVLHIRRRHPLISITDPPTPRPTSKKGPILKQDRAFDLVDLICAYSNTAPQIEALTLALSESL